MSDGPDDPSLIALGAAISDGAAVDWDRVRRDAGNAEQQQLVDDLSQLAALVAAVRSTNSGTPPAAAPGSQAPRAGSWRHLVLFEAVGAGAFGTVYRAWDPHLDREVAVKLLPRKTTGVSPLAEARNLARIRHANVVTVHGADHDDEHVGIWMELVEGQTLAAMVRDRGPMCAREVTGIGGDLCHALSSLHAAGLLHRDIKPHNVMRETGGRIVLMDFSGAQAMAQDARSDVFSGTPLFMAPELFHGHDATVVTDVYSLGVLLFFLLTGTVPVEGRTVDALKAAHAQGMRKRLHDVRADLPDAIVRVIERATAPDPRRAIRQPASSSTRWPAPRALTRASLRKRPTGQGCSARPDGRLVSCLRRRWFWQPSALRLSSAGLRARPRRARLISRWGRLTPPAAGPESRRTAAF